MLQPAWQRRSQRPSLRATLRLLCWSSCAGQRAVQSSPLRRTLERRARRSTMTAPLLAGTDRHAGRHEGVEVALAVSDHASEPNERDDRFAQKAPLHKILRAGAEDARGFLLGQQPLWLAGGLRRGNVGLHLLLAMHIS